LFTWPLSILLFFMITMPILDYITSKLGVRSFCGEYAAIGLAVSGCSIINLFSQVSASIVISPTNGGLSFARTACLRIDMLSVFMGSIFIGLGFLVAIYSIKYMENESGITLYYTLLLGMISGMTGVVFAGDFFTLFIFWELMCISSYVLVAFRKQDWEPIEAGLKYIIMSSAGSTAILFGLSFLYGMTGTLNFEGISWILNNAKLNPRLSLPFLFLLTGFGIKAAIVPLHTWLPDAYSAAPTPISAMLAGAVTETGVYALCRTFFIAFLPIQIQWSIIIASLSIITMTFGNVVALLQKDVKRLLAYSSIGHIGYMLAGLSVGTQIGLTGTILHIFNHAMMKGTAFLCVGTIIISTKTRMLEDMAGIGRKKPITTICLAISLLALIGMPPLNGFVSKLILFTSTVEANMFYLGIAIILNSVLSAAFYLRLLRILIMPLASKKFDKVRETPILMLAPISVMVILIILFGIWPEPILEFSRKAVDALLSMNGSNVGIYY
jgi:proton-translocating NADH-quinone oxidoreductase chain N